MAPIFWTAAFNKDPFVIAGLALAFSALFISIISLTVTARKSANDAWEAVRRQPRSIRKSPLPTPSPDRRTGKSVDHRRSLGSLTIMESIAEEPVSAASSSTASMIGLLNDWHYLEVPDHVMDDSALGRKTKRASWDRLTLPSVLSFDKIKNKTPENERWWESFDDDNTGERIKLSEKDCWWKDADYSNGKSNH